MSDTGPRPGLVIAPTGIGEVLDLGFNLGRRNFKLLAGLSAWGLVPASLLFGLSMGLSLAISPEVFVAPRFGSQAAMLLALGVGVVAYVLLYTLAVAAVSIACARIIDPSGTSHDLTARSVYAAALDRLGALTMLGLIVVCLAIPTFLLAICFVPLVLGLFLLVRWSQAWLAIVLERAGPIASFGRSWALTRGSWWHTFVVLLAQSIIIGILSYAVSAPFSLLGSVGTFIVDRTGVTVAANFLGHTIAAVVLTPFSCALVVVLYYELRARTEGWDIAQRAAQLAPAE